MPKVLVANNSELLRHLAAPSFRRLALDLVIVSTGPEAMAAVARERPQLAILDAEMPEMSGYDIATKIRAEGYAAKVVLVLGKRLSHDQMRKVADCGCDEVLIAPMSADELHDVVAIQLGMPRHGATRYKLELFTDGRLIDATVTNLSIDGARLVTQEQLAEGAKLEVRVSPESLEGTLVPGEVVSIPAKVVWSQPREARTVVGAQFETLDDAARRTLSRLTQWEIVDDTARTRIVLKGDFTEATSFEDLAPAMVGRVDFDMAQVRYMNSLGVRAWCDFLKAAPIQGYEFHACSVPFILQASMVDDVVGRGTVTSFFAPYHCPSCDHQEERLLQSAAILSSGLEPPVFSCPTCNAQMTFDDLPERYFAFLDRED
jgi:DNA-binding response OmpR family regulator